MRVSEGGVYLLTRPLNEKNTIIMQVIVIQSELIGGRV